MESGVKDLENEITCAVCHEFYQEPKVLSCCHYYCKHCIYRIALLEGLDKPFCCPECRKETTLPQGRVDNLQTAFFINRLKELHTKLGPVTGQVDVKCELCSADKAEAFCRQCVQFICAECVKSHQRMKKAFPGHKISTLEELKEGGAEEILVQEPTLPTCKLHDELMKFYCFDCSCLVCRDCTVEDHLGHKYQSIKKAAPGLKTSLKEHLSPLREICDNLTHAVKEIQSTRSEVEAQGKTVAQCINRKFDEIQQIVEHHRQQLLSEAESKTAEKIEDLSGQEKCLSAKSATVQSVVDYTEQCIGHSADDELMCIHVELQNKIDRALEEHQEDTNLLEPTREADMTVEVSCIEELKQLIEAKTKITQLSFDFSVDGAIADNAEVGRTSTFEGTVHANFTNGMPMRRKIVLECDLKSLVSESSTKCDVVMDRISTGNNYRVQFTPTVRGRHELILTVNGADVPGGVFPFLVSIDPKKLGKPVNVFSGLKGPNRVAFNTEGKLLITEFHGGLAMLDKFGIRLPSIAVLDFRNPRGVAVDEDDNIYFADQHANFIFKTDKKMKNFLKKKVEAIGHWDIAIIKDEIIVCERDNRGVIKVYNKRLEYIRQITSPSPGKFSSISSDKHHNIYVTDEEDSCVRVFTNGGQFLRSFGTDNLQVPCGLCVTDQYVYVCDIGLNNVSVFTAGGGNFVASFGRKGQKEGNFDYSFGVNVDRDGFVYICDCCNSRIQVF